MHAAATPLAADARRGAPELERVGRFRVVRLIGRGGTAAVYEVVLDGLERRFALKVLVSQGAISTHRLEREARALARLRHPHIVAPVDFGADAGAPYLVMELVEGETLGARLARAGRYDLEGVAAVLLPVCSALAAAHALGIVHRDLKPSNVMLARGLGGRAAPKVLDFGLARSTTTGDATLTGEGVLGTVGYFSPEAARGEKDVGPLADVYSIGVMIYECATGRRPFGGESAYDVMHAIVTGDYEPPSAVVPGLPPSFDAVVAAALACDRSRRTASVRLLGRALLEFADPVTRAFWEPELAADPVTLGPLTMDLEPAGTTLTEHHLTAIRDARPQREGGWRGKRAALVALPVAALFALAVAPPHVARVAGAEAVAAVPMVHAAPGTTVSGAASPRASDVPAPSVLANGTPLGARASEAQVNGVLVDAAGAVSPKPSKALTAAPMPTRPGSEAPARRRAPIHGSRSPSATFASTSPNATGPALPPGEHGANGALILE